MEETKTDTLRRKPSRAWPANSSRDPNRGKGSPKSSTSNSSPRSPRPGPSPRIASAPLLPLLKDTKPQTTDDDLYKHRGSVVSILDDPFFKNYQSPQSVNLSQEMKSATQQPRRGEEVSEVPSPRSATKVAVDNSVNLPVRPFHSFEHIESGLMEICYKASVEKRDVRYQYCNHRVQWCWKNHPHPKCSWSKKCANIQCF
jgi:hypothetical protein